MGLGFILGRAGSGKTSLILAEMAGELAAASDGPPLVLLVPEQATFQTEQALLAAVAERTGRAGFARASVSSFQRLAWLVSRKVAGEAAPVLGEVGRRMVLRALLARHAGDLRLFERVAGRSGFVASLAATISELRRQGLGLDEVRARLAALMESGQGGRVLAAKLHDLALVLSAYEEYLTAGTGDPGDRLARLAQHLPEAGFLRGARVWVDGFSSFTPQELDVLRALLGVAAEVRIALCLDPDEQLGDPPDEAALFHPTRDTHRRLQDLAARDGFGLEPPQVLRGSPRFLQPLLAHLERELFSFPGDRYTGDPEGLTLLVAPTRRAEVETVARAIRTLAQGGMRYRDIVVLARDPEVYHDTVVSVFARHDIPVFIDRLRPASHHPLVEALRAAVASSASDWTYEHVFRFLKTDLTRASREDVDLLENYALEFGIRGRHWRSRAPWRFRRRLTLEDDDVANPREDLRLRRVNAARRRAVRELLALDRRLEGGRGRREAREFTRAIRRLMEDLEVPDRVRRWSEEAEAAGDVESAQEHLQVLSGVEDVLDQLDAHLGNFTMDAEEYLNVLEAGLEAIRVGLIPPGLDQVTVASVERSRLPGARAAFLLGATDDAWPRPATPDVIFTDAEREELAAAGFELGATARVRTHHEQYLTYIAMTRARERLCVSHPAADEEGRRLAPAFFARRLMVLVPRLRETRVLPDVPPEEATVRGPFAAALARSLASLRDRARFTPAATALSAPGSADHLLDLYHWTLAQPDLAALARPLLRAVGYRREMERIPAQLVDTLYGDSPTMTVTRLESFASCPFQHFARYGLGLRPRPRQRLAAPELGLLYHAALSLFTRRLAERNRDWSDLDEREVREGVAEAVATLEPRLQNEILASSGHHQYMKRVVTATLEVAVGTLVRHAQRGRFRPAAVEAGFGPGADAPLAGLELDAGGRRRVVLAGRIDRIEAAAGTGGRRWIRVVDFKSSPRDLDLNRALAGLALQLGLYLIVAVENAGRLGAAVGPAAREVAAAGADGAERALPAGLLYFTVYDPVSDAAPGVTSEAAGRKRDLALKARGWVLDDAEAIRAMDESVRGDLVPVELRRDGQPKKTSSVLSPRQMEAFLNALRERAAALGEAILAGEVGAEPYLMGAETPCAHCDYRPICQFDPQVEGFGYRRIPKRPRRAILESLVGTSGRGEGGQA